MANDRCFYCKAMLSKGNVQMDHFPIPKECGGTDVVSSCITCHDMKDRFTLEKWPPDIMATLISDFDNVSRFTRIFLAKAIKLIIIHSKQGQPCPPNPPS